MAHRMRTIAVLAGLAGVLAAAGPRSGRVAIALWLPRLLGQAWSPVVSIAGAITGAWALACARRRTAAVALGGSALAARYAVGALGSWAPGRLPRAGGECLPDQELGRLEGGHVVLADLWRPSASTPRSGIGIVYLHGGLWQALDKGFLISPLMRMLTAGGHVVLDVAYPLAPGSSFEMMEAAVELAVRRLTESAPEGVRPDRIVLVGHAGGGHLALVHAFRRARRAVAGGAVGPPIRGVVAISAVTDVTAYWAVYGRLNPGQPEPGVAASPGMAPRVHDATPMDRLVTRLRLFPAYRYGNLPGGARLLHDLFGGSPAETPDRYAAWSPTALASPGCPPVLQVVGGDDAVIPASQGRALHDALTAAGVTSTLIQIPRAVHGFDQYPGVSRRLAPAARRTTTALLAFVNDLR